MLSEKEQKNDPQKICHCKQSKCMKLYCECFSSGIQCNKNCRCTDCHNRKDKFNRPSLSAAKLSKPQSKENKGCSCRKSFCVKKYCECFQEGLLCNENCKCVDCQNNESMLNRNVLIDLKRNGSTNSSKNCSLYPIILSQNQFQINNIAEEETSGELNTKWLQKATEEVCVAAYGKDKEKLMDTMVGILKKLEGRLIGEDVKEPIKLEQ